MKALAALTRTSRPMFPCSFINFSQFKFSGASHGHSNHEEDIHQKRFDHVRYTRKLNQQERREQGQEVLFYDNINEPTAQLNYGHIIHYCKTKDFKKPIMVPYEDELSEDNSSILDRSEIKARIYNLLRQFDFMDLSKFDFEKDYEKELGLDSLDWTAILTSIEYEFHTAFNDTFYEHWRTINQVVDYLDGDHLIF